MTNEAILYEQVENIVTITYNRPDQQNAINGQMRKELNAAWDKFNEDESAWVAIITGSGNVFCGGADLRDPAGSTGDFKGTFWEKPTINSFESGKEIFKPVIAAVNGPCIGYGLTAVSFCDFVIASDTATFSYPEVSIGIPTIVGAIRLPRKINWADAMELLLLGEPISAERAKEIGFVWKVCEPEGLMGEAVSLAEQLCQSAPLAVRATKEVATRTQNMGWIEAVRFGETMRVVANQTKDASEGRAAFREKRKPQWKGN
ncbi:MAG: crotonase [Euryarchaeota archaeon]|mgnify:FL=1|nr:crotonase [Euryarchaeota archaeon]|tara:strand:- start:3188 stop:3967 length:780 start_codon:yes stop_codon:yes gene_type:complete